MGGTFFAKYRGPFSGSQMSGGGIIILRVIRRHFLACGHGPSCHPLHVQSTSNACRSLLTPRREHQGGGRRRGLGREQHRAREDSTVVSHAEEYEGLLVRVPSLENNSRCGSVEGWLCQRWEYGGAVRPARQYSRARGGGSRQSHRRLFERLEQKNRD